MGEGPRLGASIKPYNSMGLINGSGRKKDRVGWEIVVDVPGVDLPTSRHILKTFNRLATWHNYG